MLNPIYTANMTDQQRAWFSAEYQRASKSEIVGILLALFLGAFGAHRFYMGETGLGILYLIFFWTGIPSLVSFIECFLMPGRVREYNAAQAQMIMARVSAAPPQSRSVAASGGESPEPEVVPRICSACRATAQVGAVFCARCGAGTVASN